MENNIIPTIGVLIIKNQKVLLVCHGEAAEHISGKYGLPAGRVENNETIEEAAVRELKEETGLETTIDDLILLPKEWTASIERKDGIKQFSLKVFLVDKFIGELMGTDENIPKWIDLKEIEKYDLLPNIKNIIDVGLKLLRTEK